MQLRAVFALVLEKKDWCWDDPASSAKCENSPFDEPGFRRVAPGNEWTEQWRQGGPQKERKWAKSGTELKSVARPLKNSVADRFRDRDQQAGDRGKHASPNFAWIWNPSNLLFSILSVCVWILTSWKIISFVQFSRIEYCFCRCLQEADRLPRSARPSWLRLHRTIW